MLYDVNQEEFIALNLIFENSKNIFIDISNALKEINNADPNNINLWRSFYDYLGQFVNEMQYQTDGSIYRSNDSLDKLNRILESTEIFVRDNIFTGYKVPNYFRVQVYTFMVQAYRYADNPALSLQYQDRLSDALPDLHIDRLTTKLELFTKELLAMRIENGKPRDKLSDKTTVNYVISAKILIDINDDLEFILAKNCAVASTNIPHYNSDNEEDYSASSSSFNDDISTCSTPGYARKKELALAFYKLARAFRKIDYLSHAKEALRNAWSLDNYSNQYVIELAKTFQKEAKAESLAEAILLLQLQSKSAQVRLAPLERFQIFYYLTIMYCQAAHHHLKDNAIPAAFEQLLGAKSAALKAEEAIVNLVTDETASELRLGIAKAYYNLLTGVINKASRTYQMAEFSIDQDRIRQLDRSEIAGSRMNRLDSKFTFFMGLPSGNLPDKIVSFTNTTLAI